jgi:hypothetical protein
MAKLKKKVTWKTDDECHCNVCTIIRGIKSSEQHNTSNDIVACSSKDGVPVKYFLTKPYAWVADGRKL